MDKTQEEQEIEKKISQYQNRQKILLNKKRTEEHRARTRHHDRRRSQGISACALPPAGGRETRGKNAERRGRRISLFGESS